MGNNHNIIKLSHQPCEVCGSSDAKTIYEGGSSHCFSCNNTKQGDNSITYTKKDNKVNSVVVKKQKQQLLKGIVKELKVRNIDENTCKLYDYKYNEEKKLQIANYRNKEGRIVAQKTRSKDKDFRWIGDSKEITLYGSHMFKSGGKKIIITEGEIDSLSISKIFKNKIPVVSIPNGAGNAVRDLLKNFEYVDSFEEIIIAFDNDEAGQSVIEDVSNLFQPGKTKIVRYTDGYKDANDYLKDNKDGMLVNCIYNAEILRPDSIISGDDISLEDLIEPMEGGIEFPYNKLNDMTMGIRENELMLITAGSGIGKSTLAREIAYDFKNKGKKVSMIFLEEQYKKTAQAFICLDNNVPLKDFRINPTKVLTIEQIKKSKEKLFDKGINFYNHFGSIDSENLINKIRFMRTVLKTDVVFLDHISIVVSGNRLSDERKELDIIMTSLKSLCEETGLIIIAIVHLKRKSGGDFNEGGNVSLTDLRGSASLEQLSDQIIALERNQQADGDEKNKLQIRVLKCRETGDTGIADKLKYNKLTGRIEDDNNKIDLLEDQTPKYLEKIKIKNFIKDNEKEK
jgi:twinkle protein